VSWHSGAVNNTVSVPYLISVQSKKQVAVINSFISLKYIGNAYIIVLQKKKYYTILRLVL
jgi:hypothetical protein